MLTLNTIRTALFEPKKIISEIPHMKNLIDAIIFIVVFSFVSGILSIVGDSSQFSQILGENSAFIGIFYVLWIVFYPVVSIVASFIGVGLHYLFLRMLCGLKLTIL